MTKDQKRISELEKEIKELREQVLQLAMRTPYIYYTRPIVNPTIYPQPWTLPQTTITCGNDTRTSCGNDTRTYSSPGLEI